MCFPFWNNRQETPNDGKVSYLILYIMIALGVLAIIAVVWKYFLSGAPLSTKDAEIIFKAAIYIIAAVFALIVVRGILKLLGLDE